MVVVVVVGEWVCLELVGVNRAHACIRRPARTMMKAQKEMSLESLRAKAKNHMRTSTKAPKQYSTTRWFRRIAPDTGDQHARSPARTRPSTPPPSP